jgi:DNA-binding MarR family transcriptional regulator
MESAAAKPSSPHRIAAELRSLAGQLESFEAVIPADGASRWLSVPALLRTYLRARRAREAILPADMFADPAWDLLLDLLLSDLEHRRVSVSAACIAASVPSTTALRWISLLESRGAIVRIADPADRRRAHLQLSAPTRASLLEWVERHLAGALSEAKKQGSDALNRSDPPPT